MSTLLSYAAGLMAALSMIPAALADGGSGESVEPATIVITLSDGSEGNKAVLRVPDGIAIRTVTSIAGVAREFEPSKLSLMILPENDITTVVAGGRQAAIRILPPKAEIYITKDMPYEFVELLSEQIHKLRGVEAIYLRSSQDGRVGRGVPSGEDPFGPF